VSVRRTGVFSEAKATPTGSVEKGAMDSDQLCPLHNKPHALRKCRTFRSRPIEERKTYLKQKNIFILLGRDILQMHKVREQYNGDHKYPYAQHLDLGWVIVGDVCPDRAPIPHSFRVTRHIHCLMDRHSC